METWPDDSDREVGVAVLEGPDIPFVFALRNAVPEIVVVLKAAQAACDVPHRFQPEDLALQHALDALNQKVEK
jgi:hypothetical protein